MTQRYKKSNSVNRRAAEVSQLIAGAAKHLSPTDPVRIGGLTLTFAEAIAKMQAYVDNRAATVAAQAAVKDALAVEDAAWPGLAAFVQAFEAMLRASFGPQAAVLVDFGLTPPKPRRTLTAEEQAVATAKRLATRKARGITGPKQKSRVKGHVTATLVVSPATDPGAAT